jgi:hypothetical protein
MFAGGETGFVVFTGHRGAFATVWESAGRAGLACAKALA